MWKKTEFYGVVAQAQDMVPGFKEGYRKFEQEVILRGQSKGLLTSTLFQMLFFNTFVVRCLHVLYHQIWVTHYRSQEKI